MTERSSFERLSAIDSEIRELLRARRAVVASGDQAAGVRLAQNEEAEFAAVFSAIAQSYAPSSSSASVAYFGSRGSFTHMAAQLAFKGLSDGFESGTIRGVFDSVVRRQADFGVVPVENSTEGGVSATLDGLLESSVLIQRELTLPIAQCLLSQRTELAKIRRVYSHPQALGQCRLWLATHLPHAELLAESSTTEAAERAAREPDSAAIASRLAGELSGLQLVRPSIQDQADNVTRFLVIGREPVPPSGRDKTSLGFATAHTRGALCDILDVFRRAELNLTRIESRPGRDRLWEYSFFVDIEGHQDDAPLRQALAESRQRCLMLKVFGSYPRCD